MDNTQSQTNKEIVWSWTMLEPKVARKDVRFAPRSQNEGGSNKMKAYRRDWSDQRR